MKIINQITKAIQNPTLIVNRLNMAFHRIEEWFYAVKDSRYLSRKQEKILFVDLGANLGQGYSWFSNHFNGDNVDFELFEPNPNCLKELSKLPDVKKGKVKVHGVGVGVKAGSFKFYGLHESEGGKYSEGGSTVKTHASAWYAASADSTIDIEVIEFAKYLKEKSENYKIIIVKMDIEGAEVELLEKMIEDHSIELINYLYVEFHSQYQEKKDLLITKKREENIIRLLQEKNDLSLRIWH